MILTILVEDLNGNITKQRYININEILVELKYIHRVNKQVNRCHKRIEIDTRQKKKNPGYDKHLGTQGIR